MKRTLIPVAAWFVAAGLAVGLGFLAVSFVDAGAATGVTPAAATGTSGGNGGSSATSTPATPSVTGPRASGPTASVEQDTAGGSVWAACVNGVPEIASAPAAGWRLDDGSRADEVEFRNGTQQIEIRVDCSTGSPVFAVEGPRSDDHGGSGSDDRGPDDHGGHGADD